MAGINFASKKISQKIFSKKDVRATVGKKSGAMKAIMANKGIAGVLDKAGERRVFYDALKKRGMAAGSRGVTKKDLKKVLGDIEHSGQFSHKEMHKLGEELIGGVASSRIIREHAPAHSENHSQAESPRQKSVDMRKTYDEILKKDITKRGGSAEVEKKDAPADSSLQKPQQKMTFASSTELIRKAQERRENLNQNNSENFGYVPKYLKNFYRDKNSDKIKSRLTLLQGGQNEEEAEEPDKEQPKIAA